MQFDFNGGLYLMFGYNKYASDGQKLSLLAFLQLAALLFSFKAPSSGRAAGRGFLL